MDFNCYKYLEIDEQEIQNEEDKQRKEIQALLASKLNDIELDEEDDEEEEDNNNNDCWPEQCDEKYDSQVEEYSMYDKENISESTHFTLPNQPTTWLPHPIAAYYAPHQSHNLNMINYQLPQMNNNCHREEDQSINWEISLHGEMGMPISQSNNQFYSDKVSFMPTSNVPTNERSSLKRNESPITNQLSPMKITKRDVAIECIPINQRELDNLELLYSARGKRIEQLQLELESEKEKRLRETRVLNHRVTLLESEQKNESNLLKSYKSEINDQRNSLNEKERMVEMQFQNIVELENKVEKLTNTLDARNSLVESLNQQLAELNTKSNIARNNQKQTQLLDSINHHYDTDAHRYQEEIARLSDRLDTKLREIEKLQVQLDEVASVHQSHKRLWVEEKQRIIDELDEEKSCRQRLESSINQEKVHQLQNQIDEFSFVKSMMEDMNFYQQEEIGELTNQLLAYEQTIFVLDNTKEAMMSCLDVEGNIPEISARWQSCPMLSTINDDASDGEIKSNNLDAIVAMRKEILSLISRTHSLTNRLLDVRKDNLDVKSNVKKLHRTISEQSERLITFEEKLVKSESRLSQLQSGDETDVEKQLRSSIKSLEIIKESLEVQCKSLQSQLRQANETMEEMNTLHLQLEKEFNDFKDILENDKLAAIEEVKIACSNHYDNLRQQLEMSWMMEKDAFVSEEKTLREELQRDMSEAVREVDRVKNLYIQLSQQKTNEESDRTNWNEWLSKKLDDQKRSLNQQFQKDHQLMIVELNSQHTLVVKKLRTELERHVVTEDKLEGTDLEVAHISVQYGVDLIDKSCQSETNTRENWVQSNETMRGMNEMDDLTQSNDRLLDVVRSLKAQLEDANSRDMAPRLTSASSQSPSRNDGPLPHIIRSCTPQFVHSSNSVIVGNIEAASPTPLKSLPTLFRSLKEDLITQLSAMSHSLPLSANGTAKFTHKSVSTLEPMNSFDRVKEQLYSYILQMQVRAADTIQQELHSSHSRIRGDVLRQLRQILPLTLSVDGQILNVAPDKMRVLTDKLTLIIDRLHDDDYITGPTLVRDSCRSLFNHHTPIISGTSTPTRGRNHNRNRKDTSSDRTSICSDNSSDITPPKGISPPCLITDPAVRTRCEQLQEEIAKLSDDLVRTRDTCIGGGGPISSRPHTLFADVDHNWLCDSLAASVSNQAA